MEVQRMNTAVAPQMVVSPLVTTAVQPYTAEYQRTLSASVIPDAQEARMSYSIGWLIPSKVIYVQFHDQMTADSIRSCIVDGERMIREEGILPVNFIVDTQAIDYIPRQIFEIKATLQQTPGLENIGFVAIITPNSLLLRLAASLVAQLGLGSRLKLRLFTSYHAALDHVRQLETSWQGQA
ncbi:MAG: hypothetical protein KME04_10035 [Pleurocapsa minor GSE-CHR-MK-17-07R]|jgi:hypothetical protein|nr:hypothetical protein [Pleurocapsa minor GSE-CHR-MK 17-07R]